MWRAEAPNRQKQIRRGAPREASEGRPVLDGELQEGVGPAEVEFLAYAHPVVFDRPDGDKELVGDFLARLVLGDELENLMFRGGEHVEAGIVVLEKFLPFLSDDEVV